MIKLLGLYPTAKLKIPVADNIRKLGLPVTTRDETTTAAE